MVCRESVPRGNVKKNAAGGSRRERETMGRKHNEREKESEYGGGKYPRTSRGPLPAPTHFFLPAPIAQLPVRVSVA